MAIYISPLQWIKRILGGIYMESGFLDFITTGQCTESTYLPATLNFDAETAAYVSGTSTPLQGRVSANVIFNEAIVAVLNTEVALANDININESVIVTNDTGTIEYLLGTDFNVTVSGITAIAGSPIVQSQDLLVDYSPVIVAVLDETPFNGEVLITGSESLAVGCASKFPSITDPCNNTYSAGGYCGLSIQVKKATQQIVPSSMFTGKLRLFVQAIYGSTREDYAREGYNLKIGDIADAEYPPFTLNRGLTDNSWLYTTANYDYFLCTFKAGAIEFREIHLFNGGDKFRDILKNHTRVNEFTFATKVEAYILSTAKISNVVVTVSIVGDSILGSPLDYGWHATWDGHTATIVNFYDDPLLPQYLSDQHQLTINESWNGTSYTFTVTNTRLQSDLPWWPQTNGLNALYFDEQVGSMFPVPYPAILFGGYEGTFDSPIYNYYNIDMVTGAEELVTMNIFMDIATPTSYAFSLPLGSHMTDISGFTHYDGKTYTGGRAGTKGFKSSLGGDNTVNPEALSSESVQKWIGTAGPIPRGWAFDINGPFHSESYATANDWALTNGFALGSTKQLPYFNPVTQQTEIVTAILMWRATWIEFILDNVFSYGRASTGAAFLQTVLGDSSTMVVGDESTASNGIGNHSQSTNPFYVGYGGSLDWVLNVTPLGMPTLEVLAGDPPGAYYPYLSISRPSTTISSTAAQAVHTDHQLHAIFDGEYDSDTSITTAGNSSYFHPLTSSPATNTVDTGRRSVNKKYKINHTDLTRDGGFLSDSSVGWS